MNLDRLAKSASYVLTWSKPFSDLLDLAPANSSVTSFLNAMLSHAPVSPLVPKGKLQRVIESFHNVPLTCSEAARELRDIYRSTNSAIADFKQTKADSAAKVKRRKKRSKASVNQKDLMILWDFTNTLTSRLAVALLSSVLNGVHHEGSLLFKVYPQEMSGPADEVNPKLDRLCNNMRGVQCRLNRRLRRKSYELFRRRGRPRVGANPGRFGELHIRKIVTFHP